MIEKHKRKFDDNLTRDLNFKRDPLATVEVEQALDISSEDHRQNEKEVPMELVLSKKEETENQIKKDTEAKYKTKSGSEYESQKRSLRLSAKSPFPQNPEAVVQPIVGDSNPAREVPEPGEFRDHSGRSHPGHPDLHRFVLNLQLE